MVGLIIIMIVMFYAWLAFEMWRAPMMDDDGNILRPAKKISDLFKRKKP